MKYLISILIIFISSIMYGQGQIKRVLFLGNSYTEVNDLPQLIADVAASNGDKLIFDNNSPGGYTLKGHSANALSLSKIAIGNWDYVVLQEQSINPSLPISQVITDVFPYAHILDSIIHAKNSCAETVFYMTWGRKNGDAGYCPGWPPLCTYSGMDNLLRLRYRMMADSNNAIISPVGAVWKYIRQNFPLIDLYNADGSHPSAAGSYAAACCFYTALFRKNPTAITFNYILSHSDASNIKAAAKLVVYDSLMNWHIGEHDPIAKYTYINSAFKQITFVNKSVNATSCFWSFGDGNTSTTTNPIHLFPSSGSYKVSLIVSKCGIKDNLTQTINVGTVAMHSRNNNNLSFKIYPNPVTTKLFLDYELSGILTYKISNLTGIEIQRGIINNSEKQISVNSLANGLYILQLFEFNKSHGLLKFIKTSN